MSFIIFIRVKEVNEYSIYPFIHSYSNIKSDLDQLSPINVPDVLPAHLPSTVDFSMVAGDFVEVYGQQENNFGKHDWQPINNLLYSVEAWDVVVTCFFIDTAKNILEYLEVIHKILKPHGTWINIGIK